MPYIANSNSMLKLSPQEYGDGIYLMASQEAIICSWIPLVMILQTGLGSARSAESVSTLAPYIGHWEPD